MRNPTWWTFSEMLSFMKLFSVLFCTHSVLADYRISVMDMEHVHRQEWILMRSLRIYIKNMEFNLQKLGETIKQAMERRQADLELKSKRSCNHTNVTSPINTLKTVGGLLGTLDRAKRFINETRRLGKSYQKFLKGKKQLMPTAEDMRQAVNSVFQIQTANKLNVKAMADGLILPQGSKSHRMEVSDMYYLGQAAYSEKSFRTAKNWFDLVLQRLDEEGDTTLGGNEKQLRITVHDHLAYVDYMLGYPYKALKHSMQVLQLDPKNERALKNHKYLDDLLKKSIKINNETDESENNKDAENYDDFSRLCDQGKTWPASSRASPKLKCGYKQDHPILKLKPSRYEVLSLHPYIVMHHKVIYYTDIMAIQAMTIPKLGRPMVSRWIDNHYNSQQRANTWAWLNGNSAAVQKLNERLEAITGLSTETSTSIQVTRYGLANYHVPHYDWLKKYSSSAISGFKRGDRVATTLIYLNEPEHGGESVFMTPRLKIRPKQGSVLFWYNLYRDGSPDHRTQYGSCPIIAGSKWVVSKWFHSHGQEFRLPCSLDRTL